MLGTHTPGREAGEGYPPGWRLRPPGGRNRLDSDGVGTTEVIDNPEHSQKIPLSSVTGGQPKTKNSSRGGITLGLGGTLCRGGGILSPYLCGCFYHSTGYQLRLPMVWHCGGVLLVSFFQLMGLSPRDWLHVRQVTRALLMVSVPPRA